MHGLHLTADLRGCRGDAALMTDAAALRALCLAAVQEAGLQAVGELFHRFAPASNNDDVERQSGVTGVVLLAESHLAVHTWPELDGATIDAYVCNFGADNSARAARLMSHLVEAFAPAQVHRQQLLRSAPA
jgi:S-adenosylmethionine decarboxylase